MLRKLQSFILYLILFLVWFELLCFTVMLCANVLNWSFLTDAFSAAFYMTFAVGLGVLGALGVLHVTLSFNAISSSLRKLSGEAESITNTDENAVMKKFIVSIVAALMLMVVILVLFWYAGCRVDHHTTMVAMNGIESVGKSKQVDEIITAIHSNETISALDKMREVLISMNGSGKGISLVIPMKINENTVYYELRPWTGYGDDEKLADANLPVFVPYKNEKKQFEEVLVKKNPVYVRTQSTLRIFYPIVRGGKIELILLLDTSRKASNEYLKSSRMS